MWVGGWVGGEWPRQRQGCCVLSGVVQPRLRDFTVKSGAMCHCLDAVWTLSGRCLDTVWTGSGLSRHVRELHKPGLCSLLDSFSTNNAAAPRGKVLQITPPNLARRQHTAAPRARP